jgi:hypothetical protein
MSARIIADGARLEGIDIMRLGALDGNLSPKSQGTYLRRPAGGPPLVAGRSPSKLAHLFFKQLATRERLCTF